MNIIQGLYCECNNEADRNCERCQAYLCDNCDKGTVTDQCSLCASCKNEQIEFYSTQNIEYWEGIKADLQLVKDSCQFYKQDAGIQKFASLAYLINWDVSNICADNTKVKMTNERYRFIKRELIEALEIGHIQRKILNDE